MKETKGVKETGSACSLCGEPLISVESTGFFACQNCDLYPDILQEMTEQERMNRQAVAQVVVTEYRRRNG